MQPSDMAPAPQFPQKQQQFSAANVGKNLLPTARMLGGVLESSSQISDRMAAYGAAALVGLGNLSFGPTHPSNGSVGQIDALSQQAISSPWSNAPNPNPSTPQNTTQFTFWQNNLNPQTGTTYLPQTTVGPYQSKQGFSI